MGRIRDYLSDFDDHELAFFAKYKLRTYMPQSQAEINSYLSERSISGIKVERLISENPESKLADNKQRCFRCYSDRLRKSRVTWAETAILPNFEKKELDAERPTKDAFEIQITCDVCGLKNEDPNKPGKQSAGIKMRKYFRSVLDGILEGF